MTALYKERLLEMMKERGINEDTGLVGSGIFDVHIQSADGEAFMVEWNRGSAYADPLTTYEVLHGLYPDIYYYHRSGGNYAEWVRICDQAFGGSEVDVSRSEFRTWEYLHDGVKRVLGEDLFAEYIEMEMFW